jgi:hypothetical protein
MTQAADAGNGNPLSRFRSRFFDAFIGGDAGANDRSGFDGLKAGGNVGDVIWIGQNVFGKAAVLGVAAELRVGTNRLPSGQAIFAMTARRIKPGHTHAVAYLDDAVTPAPTATTGPMASWPGMNGGVGFTGQSPCHAWTSV